MNGEWEGFWKELVVALSRYYLCNCLKKMRENDEILVRIADLR
jgi:hypothetical protein